MGGDNLAGMFGAMDASQIGGFDPADVLTAITQMQGEHFQFLDSESAGGLLVQIGIEQAVNLDASQLAGFFGVLEGAKISEFGQDQIVAATGAMSARDFQLVAADSALAMYSGMGGDQALNLQGDQLAGLFGSMDLTAYQEVGAAQVFAVINAMGIDQAAGVGGENLAGMFGTIDNAQLGSFDPAQLFQVAFSIGGDQFQAMGAENAQGIIQNMGIDLAVNLGSDQLAGVFGVFDPAQFANFESGDILNVAGAINGGDFQALGADNANAMMNRMDFTQALGLGGETIGGLFGAMDEQQLGAFDPTQMLAAAQTMLGEHFQFMDPDSSLAMFNGIELAQTLELQSGQLAGMFGAMDPSQYQDVDGDQLLQVMGNINKDDFAGFDSDQALNIATGWNLLQFGSLEADQLFGLTTAIDANQVAGLGSDALQVVVNQVNVDDFQTLNPDLAGAILGVVSDDTIAGFDPERALAALVASGADFFQSGGGIFNDIVGGDTVFDQQQIGTSDALLNLVDPDLVASFFGAIN
jgi:hypothetical protein